MPKYRKMRDCGAISAQEHSIKPLAGSPPTSWRASDNAQEYGAGSEFIAALPTSLQAAWVVPKFTVTLVRNFPGKIFNADKPCNNDVYAGLRPFAKGDHVPDTGIGSDP